MLTRVLFLLSLLAIAGAPGRADEPGLLAHWPLAGDARDASGNGRDAIAHGVDFQTAEGSAGFDGVDDFLEVPAKSLPGLGAGDFSLTMWAWTGDHLDDAVGDFAGKFDPERRRGFAVAALCHTGVTTSTSNDRQLSFSMDAGTTPTLEDCGRPGDAVYAMALACHDGRLYAGAYDGGAGVGRVHRYEGAGQWKDLALPARANAVMALASFEGALYAGVGRYNAAGSALAASRNDAPGGAVFRWDPKAGWIDCGSLPGAAEVMAMAPYRDHLYAIPLYSRGVFRYDGGQTWTRVGDPEKRLMSLAVHNGRLLAAGNEGGGVYRFDPPDRWTEIGRQANVTQTYSFAVIEGQLCVGTWPEGKVFRDAGALDWQSVGRLGAELEVMGMLPYVGKLYAGTLPLAQVYRFDGVDRWSLIGRVDLTPDVKYRRAWSMAIHGGKLYVGTLPSGRVHSITVGRQAGFDRSLAPGWRSLAAVRAGDRLHLYVDGEPVGASTPFDPKSFDASNDRPLLLGAGPHDFFHGRLRDVRLYGRALRAEEIRQQADAGAR